MTPALNRWIFPVSSPLHLATTSSAPHTHTHTHPSLLLLLFCCKNTQYPLVQSSLSITFSHSVPFLLSLFPSLNASLFPVGDVRLCGKVKPPCSSPSSPYPSLLLSVFHVRGLLPVTPSHCRLITQNPLGEQEKGFQHNITLRLLF